MGFSLRHLADDLNPFDGPKQPVQKAQPARLPQQGQAGFGVARPGAPVMQQPAAPRPRPQPSFGHMLGDSLKQVGTAGTLGLMRTGVGIAQDASGLADLAGQKVLHKAPSGTTSRIDKGLDSFAKNLDQTAQTQVQGPAKSAYHIAQAAGTAASFMAPSAAVKSISALPKVAAALEHTAPATNLVSKVAAPTTRLVGGVGNKLMPGTDAVGRVAGAVVKGGLSKTNLLNATGGTIAQVGGQASHGQDVNRGTVARDFGMNAAFGAGLSGGGQLAREAVPSGVSKAFQSAAPKIANATQAGLQNAADTVKPLQQFVRDNRNITAQQKPLRTQIAATQAKIDALPLGDAKAQVAAENYQRRIDSLQGRHDALEASRPKIKLPNQQGFIAGPLSPQYAAAKVAGKVFKGVDGKPRFEVDDSGAKIKNLQGKTLGDVLDHPQLYENYPDLKNTPVVMDNTLVGKKGEFDGKTLRLNPKATIDAEELRRTILHETQHNIQDIEKFASGGSPETFRAADYGKIADEMGRVHNRIYAPKSIDKLLAPMQRSRLHKKFDGLIAESKTIDSATKNNEYADKYRRLAGEAEARAVEARASMSPAYRDAKPFYNSLDVPKKDLIVRHSKDTAMSMKPVNGADTAATKREIAELDRMINAFTEDSTAKQVLVDRRARRAAELAPTLDSVNPTGKVFTDYNPASRTGELGKNMTTLDKVAGKHPDELVTVYRGAPSTQSKLAAGDFITTNKQLAKDYAGTGKVIEEKVPSKHIATDPHEWEGEEYIYHPEAPKKNLYDKLIDKLPNESGYVKIPGSGEGPTPLERGAQAESRKNVGSSEGSVAQPQVKLSHTGKLYIKHDGQVINNLPKTVQDAIYSHSQGEVLTPDRMVKVNNQLNKHGLELGYDNGKPVISSVTRSEPQTKQETLASSYEQGRSLSSGKGKLNNKSSEASVAQDTVHPDLRRMEQFYIDKLKNASEKDRLHHESKLRQVQNDIRTQGGEPKTAPGSSTTPALPRSRGAVSKPETPASTVSRSSGGSSSLKDTPKMSIPEDAPSSGMRQRGLATTIQDDPNTAPAVKAQIGEMYKVRNTKDLQSRASNLVKEDPELAMRVFKSDSNSDVGTMIGGELAAHLSRNGNHEAALEVAQTMSREATHRGQANQALSTWGKLAPESILRFAQSTVNEYNKRAGLAGGAKELKLTPETAQKLTGMSEDLQKMQPGRDKDIATQQMLNTVKELVPASWVRKLGTVQTIGQLLNPKTLIRNIGGNTMFGGLENVSQTLAAGIDKGLSAARGTPREVALPNLKTQLQGAIKGGKEQYAETTKGVNLGPDTQFDLGDTQTFTKGFMGGVEKTMGVALRVPDRAALTAAVDDTVAGLMKANKLKAPTQEILDEAAATGLYRTFQDNSKAAQLFTGLKGALNTVGATGKDGKRFGLGDLILKYPKTPGNILSRGIDYSPVGIVKGLYEIAKPAIKGQPFNQRAFSMAVSRGVVGSSALMGAGAALGALGIITEKPSQDTDTRNLQKASGLGGYQINTSALRRFITSGLNKDAAQLKQGDTLVSYDWAQPASIPLSAGAALGKGKSGVDGAVSTLDNAASGLNSLIEQPLVTGVNTFATNIKNYGLIGAGAKVAQGGPASFVPTLSNQLRQLTDNNTRSTYDPKGTQTAINMVKNKVPGLDRSLPNRVGQLGENLQNYQNGTNNVFNVAFNPAFVNKYQPNQDAKLPLDILKNSGNKTQIPTTTKPSQNVNGTNQKLTATQNHDFQQFVGTQTKQLLSERRNDPSFMALSDDDKAKDISGRISDIQAAARAKILGDTPGKTQAKAVDKVLTGNLTYQEKAGNAGAVSSKIDAHSQKVLKEYNDLDSTTRQSKAYKENDYDYKVAQAKYDNDKANGKLSRAQDISRQDALKRAKIGADFSKDIRETYTSLSKDEVYDLIHNDKDGQKIADQLLAYGDALKQATGTQNKFRTSKGAVAFTSSKSGGSKGGSRASLAARMKMYGSSGGSAMNYEKSLRSLVQNAHLSKARA